MVLPDPDTPAVTTVAAFGKWRFQAVLRYGLGVERRMALVRRARLPARRAKARGIRPHLLRNGPMRDAGIAFDLLPSPAQFTFLPPSASCLDPFDDMVFRMACIPACRGRTSTTVFLSATKSSMTPVNLRMPGRMKSYGGFVEHIHHAREYERRARHAPAVHAAALRCGEGRSRTVERR